MIRFILMAMNALKSSESFIMIFTAHTLVNAGRAGAFFYAYLNLGVANILLWSGVIFFYIVQMVLRSGYSSVNETQKYYQYIEWTLHLVFNLFFVYTAVLYSHYEHLVLELALYWIFEWIYRIVRFKLDVKA